MASTKLTAHNLEWTFSDGDIVNPDDIIYAGEYNPHNVRGWLLHDHGFTICVVFADSLQEALDVACDENKLNRYLIPSPASLDSDNAASPLDPMDYLTADPSEMAAGFDVNCPERVIDGVQYWWRVEPAFLGNAGEAHDIETLGYVEFAAPSRSFCAQCGESMAAKSFHCA